MNEYIRNLSIFSYFYCTIFATIEMNSGDQNFFVIFFPLFCMIFWQPCHISRRKYFTGQSKNKEKMFVSAHDGIVI